MKKSVLVLFSGGMDSATLLAHYISKGFNVQTIFFNYGQPRYRSESVAVRKLTDRYLTPVDVVPTANLEFAEKGFVPMRNAFLLCHAINYAYKQGIPSVAYGACHGGYLDVRPEFVDRFNFMQEYCLLKPIYVLAPFANWSKERVLKYGLRLKVPFELTHSCMQSPSCGKCPACKLRAKYNLKEIT